MARHAGAAARAGGRAAGRPRRQRAGRDRHAARRSGADTERRRRPRRRGPTPRNDLQYFGSPPTMPTACSDHRPVTRQRCSPSARRDDARVRLGASSSGPTCGLGLGHGRHGTGLQEQLLIDLAGLALRCDNGEQLAGDVHQRTRVCAEIVIVFIKIGCCGPSLAALEGQGRRPGLRRRVRSRRRSDRRGDGQPSRHALRNRGAFTTGRLPHAYCKGNERGLLPFRGGKTDHIAAQPFTAASIFGTKIQTS
jgi:hypothetical protein